jgi:hypothetical protein
MRRCAECGAPNTDEARFCRICGEPLPLVQHANTNRVRRGQLTQRPHVRQQDGGPSEQRASKRPRGDLYKEPFENRRRDENDVHETEEEHKHTTNIIAAAIVIAVISIILVLFPFFRSAHNTRVSSNAALTQAASNTTPTPTPTPTSSDSGTSTEASGTSTDAFGSVTASSELVGQQSNTTYSASLAVDGNQATAWNEGASGDGVGESITLSADSVQHVSGIRIMGGSNQSTNSYTRNNRPRKITVSYDGGQKQVELQDLQGQFQDVSFDATVETSTITITIDSVYKGSKYTDCCISEIEVY